jgi:low temperature requirement protein LtrA
VSEPRDEVVRVSTLELFFDLVFVFTITQLTTVLIRHTNARGVTQVVLMLGVIWWMYGGYAWLTNAVAPDRAGRRLLLLGGMAAYLVLALSIPKAFSNTGLTFGLAYLAVVSVHGALFTRTSEGATIQALFRLAPFNLVSALVVVAGGIAGGTAQYVLWALAFVLEWTTPSLIPLSGFVVGPAHFVERHGLVVIVAIGESIVAIGLGAAGLAIDLPLVVFAVLGLALSACLWWAYFGGDEERAERALANAPLERRSRMALDAFGYWHMPILFGIVAIAATLKKATGHAFDALGDAQALMLAVGVSVFMLGDMLYRRSLRIGPSGNRLAVAILAPATIPLGTEVSAFAQVTALVVLLVAALGMEQRADRADHGRGFVDEPTSGDAQDAVAG